MAQSLTVVQLLPALDGGGVERGTLEIGRALVEQGHRSIVVSAGGRLVAQLLAEGSEHHTWEIGRKRPWTLRWVPRLRRLLETESVDILHLRSRLPGWIGYWAWKGVPPPHRPHLVTTVHGFNSVGVYSGVMTRGERIIAVSEAIHDFILANYPAVDPARIRVIPRGVDPTEFPFGYRPSAAWLARWRQQFPGLQGRTVLTLPGRVSRLKGHRALVRLLVDLRDQGIDAIGLVVGDAAPGKQGYLAEIRSLAARAGVELVFTGQRADMRDVYTVSDLVLSLSEKEESFGRTVVEALALGVPVVGYDRGGVGEILAHDFPPGRAIPDDPASLAARVIGILRGEAPVVPTGHFTLERMQSQTLAVYRELCEADG